MTYEEFARVEELLAEEDHHLLEQAAAIAAYARAVATSTEGYFDAVDAGLTALECRVSPHLRVVR